MHINTGADTTVLIAHPLSGVAVPELVMLLSAAPPEEAAGSETIHQSLCMRIQGHGQAIVWRLGTPAGCQCCQALQNLAMNAGLLCLGYDQHLLTTMLAHVAALRVPAACMAVYQSAPCIAKWGRDIEMEHQVGSGHSLCCSTQASSASSLVFNGLLGESTADANTGSALRGSPFDAGCLDIKQASAGAYASAASVNETYAEAAPRHLA